MKKALLGDDRLLKLRGICFAGILRKNLPLPAKAPEFRMIDDGELTLTIYGASVEQQA